MCGVCVAPGDTRPTPTLDALAKGTDVFILQNMGPIKDLAKLSPESQLLINVGGQPPGGRALHCRTNHTAYCYLSNCHALGRKEEGARMAGNMVSGQGTCDIWHASCHAAAASAAFALQTSHVTPQQAGAIFAAAGPRLAVAHHLTVNAASRAAIIQDIRAGYPQVGQREGQPDLACSRAT